VSAPHVSAPLVVLGPPPEGRGGYAMALRVRDTLGGPGARTLNYEHFAPRDLQRARAIWTFTAHGIRVAHSYAPEVHRVWQWIAETPSYDLGIASIADAIVVTSERAAARVPAHLRGRVHVAPHGVEPEFAPASAPPAGVPHVLSVGSGPAKGGALLARVAQSTGTRTLILGRDLGPIVYELAGTYSHIQPRWAPHAAMPQAYRSASVFAFPSSHSEAHAGALLEAMASGLPIVASDTPDHRELLGDAAILLPARGRHAHARWCEALTALMADAPRRAALGAAALARVDGRTWEAWAAAAAKALP